MIATWRLKCCNTKLGADKTEGKFKAMLVGTDGYVSYDPASKVLTHSEKAEDQKGKQLTNEQALNANYVSYPRS